MTSDDANKYHKKRNVDQKLKINALTDSEGKPSTMRLMSFISLGAAIYFGVMTMSSGPGAVDVGKWITAMFLIGAFAPKSLQKYIENTHPTKLKDR